MTKRVLQTIISGIFAGALTQAAFAGEYGVHDRYVDSTSPNYLMSYKICFGDDCTYGDEAFVRDQRGVLMSEKDQEAVLDFIWHAVSDAEIYSEEAKLWESVPEKRERDSRAIIQRHAPDIARRERLREQPLHTNKEIIHEDLSVSISFPYDEATLPQIMEAIDCFKVQLDIYKKSRSYDDFYSRPKDT